MESFLHARKTVDLPRNILVFPDGDDTQVPLHLTPDDSQLVYKPHDPKERKLLQMRKIQALHIHQNTAHYQEMVTGLNIERHVAVAELRCMQDH